MCPKECILEHRPDGKPSDLPNQLFIDPDECIDCRYCEPECPWGAIYPEADLPDVFADDVRLNAEAAIRRVEFRVPEAQGKPRPDDAAVAANRRRWGMDVPPGR